MFEWLFVLVVVVCSSTFSSFFQGIILSHRYDYFGRRCLGNDCLVGCVMADGDDGITQKIAKN